MSQVDQTDDRFIDRRLEDGSAPLGERRQFGNSYDDFAPDARELAIAIDEYKLQHHRRFITYEEMLDVMKTLGYHR